MMHRTQAVKGYPESRSWPRGVDGGAWGPQHLSPIPSRGDFQPLIPSPTTSPGRQCRRLPHSKKFPQEEEEEEEEEAFPPSTVVLASAATVGSGADIAAELSLLGLDCPELLNPFVALELDEVRPFAWPYFVCACILLRCEGSGGYEYQQSWGVDAMYYGVLWA
ncbi:unnamed protein product [Choristocarpus tenellus]